MSTGLQVRLRSNSPVRLNAEFDCAPGELVALVGASGSGKTTLLRTIAGLHQSADLAGTVQLGDQLWMDSAQRIRLPAQQRRVGLVFQHYALFPHLNAIETIALCADSMPANGLKASKNTAKIWLERLGLSELGERLPHQLSGGQQQRVALARALVRIQNGKGVLLLDEPFSAVDAPMRQVLYRELAQLRQNLNVPIILVTHDLHEARRLADRIVIIDAGESLQSGAPAHVMRSPRNARVAQLVGIHNHFHAQFHKAESGHAFLHWGDLRLKVRDKGKIDSGTQVTWVMAGEAVQVFSSSEAAAPQDNLLKCSLSEMLPLGEISLCRLAVQGTPDTIQLNLPTAQLSAMGLATGDSICLRVPLDSAHIMPLRDDANAPK
ncbi:ABC transporter ATP-binding protein [Variovorax sp. PCZ-1]|uniref:ABC transporter ATP-binding protein n=1 Tax=Variovorax sp. PCZ-1 TaxID=2835533 RepID=UPI001BCEEBFC|nr:ABC transporter ATP-binding protein [Variovorax sp. PCZ-1]MBS7806045.1 ABC transporter ATP-binding protein [Variovorax sp. PCZ-1]